MCRDFPPYCYIKFNVFQQDFCLESLIKFVSKENLSPVIFSQAAIYTNLLLGLLFIDLTKEMFLSNLEKDSCATLSIY